MRGVCFCPHVADACIPRHARVECGRFGDGGVVYRVGHASANASANKSGDGDYTDLFQ